MLYIYIYHMSDAFEQIHVKDDVIGNITNKVKYAVMTSAQNITSQPFQAISRTPAAHVFNISVPSLETVIQREVLWASTVTIAISCPAVGQPNTKPPGEYLINYGVTDALASFPLHSLVQNMTCTINNNTVSMNVADTLAPLLRLLDPEETAKFDNQTPTSLDYLGNYRDGVQRLPFVIGSRASADGSNLPAVYQPITLATQAETEPAAPGAGAPIVTHGLTAQAFQSYPNNTLAYDMNRPAASTWYHKPRGSWQLLKLWAGTEDEATTRVPNLADTTVYVQFRVTEPLLISPFTFGCQDSKQGIYGIQNITFQMNMLPNANRAWRSASTGYSKTARIVNFTESQLFFKFYTPKPSDMLESRNVVPYYEFPIYRSTGFNTLPALNAPLNANGSLPDRATADFQSSSIQLSVIPDKLIVFVRRQNAGLSCTDTDNYLTINKISINWNNQSGLLASYTPEQLYQASIASGLNNLTWEEFRGLTMSVAGTTDANSARSEPKGPLGLRGVGAVGTNAASFLGYKFIPTTGSILVLDFAKVIQLSDEYYAPGSLGQFNLQLSVNCTNNQAVDFTGAATELVIMPLLSGCMVNEKGSSSTFIGLLTKSDVLDTLQQEPYSHDQIKRLVGGSFLDSLKSGMHWISSKLPFVKNALQHVNHPIAEKAANVLGALGYSKHAHDKPKLADRLI